MKNLALLFLLLISSGCISSKHVAGIVKALGNDPATVNIRITTIYGTLTFTRTNPGSNTIAHGIQPDGAVSVGQK